MGNRLQKFIPSISPELETDEQMTDQKSRSAIKRGGLMFWVRIKREELPCHASHRRRFPAGLQKKKKLRRRGEKKEARLSSFLTNKTLRRGGAKTKRLRISS